MRVTGEAEEIVFDLFARYQAIARRSAGRMVEGTDGESEAERRGGSAISSPG